MSIRTRSIRKQSMIPLLGLKKIKQREFFFVSSFVRLLAYAWTMILCLWRSSCRRLDFIPLFCLLFCPYAYVYAHVWTRLKSPFEKNKNGSRYDISGSYTHSLLGLKFCYLTTISAWFINRRCFPFCFLGGFLELWWWWKLFSPNLFRLFENFEVERLTFKELCRVRFHILHSRTELAKIAFLIMILKQSRTITA